MHTTCARALFALPVLLSGCLTFAGDQLSEIPVEPGTVRPFIQHTVGDFGFETDGGEKLATSGQVGQEINREVLDRWVESGLISQHELVQSSEFTGDIPLRLTLGGRMHAESNVAMQVITGLTLMLIPSSVDYRMSLKFTLEDVESGCTFEATAADSYRTVTTLLLLPALPFSRIGSNRSYALLADHLYSQLAAQGAFSEHAPCETGPAEISAEARSRELEEMLASGLISQSEYEDRIREPFFATGVSADPTCSLSLVTSDAHSEARFEFRASQVGMVPGVLRCASTAATVSIDADTVEVCADGHRHPTLPAWEASERARIWRGIPMGFLGGMRAGLVDARNKDLEASFRAGQFGPAELGPSQESDGIVFFDVPVGALPFPTGATLQVRDPGTGDTRTLHLGDTTSCADD